jgi:hypothetical protein
MAALNAQRKILLVPVTIKASSIGESRRTIGVADDPRLQDNAGQINNTGGLVR